MHKLYKLHENQSRISHGSVSFVKTGWTVKTNAGANAMGKLFKFGDSETDSTYLYFLMKVF